MTVGGLPTGPTQLPHPLGGGGNHDHRGGGGVAEPGTLYIIIEGSLEVKLPTKWTDEKQSREEAERRERLEERRVRRKKMQMREKVGKLRNTVFFQ